MSNRARGGSSPQSGERQAYGSDATASELSFHSIQALTSAVGTYTNSPLTVTADQDPFLIRAKTELQMRDQVLKENELLAVVKQWQQRAKAFEFESFGTIARAVQTWEVER